MCVCMYVSKYFASSFWFKILRPNLTGFKHAPSKFGQKPSTLHIVTAHIKQHNSSTQYKPENFEAYYGLFLTTTSRTLSHYRALIQNSYINLSN